MSNPTTPAAGIVAPHSSRFEDEGIARNRAVRLLEKRLDNRRGSMLFIGACLPEVAMHVAANGLFITVVESDPERMEAFMAPLRAKGVDHQVSWDRRPYSGIEFLSSSYTYLLAWDGIVPDMEVIPFLKKTRRDLKVGGTLLLRLPVLPEPTLALPRAAELLARLPEGIRGPLLRSGRLLSTFLSPGKAISRNQLLEQAARIYNLDSVETLSVLSGRSDNLPGPLAAAISLLPRPVVDALDEKFSSTPKLADALAASALFCFAKSREFGHVFRV